MLKMTDLTVDKEFAKLFDYISPEEKAATRAKLLKNIQSDERITDPITVWLGHNIIVDGMTRFDIWCNELECSEDFAPEIIEKKFKDRDAVIQWIEEHQDGRRNTTQSRRSYLAAEKSAAKGTTLKEEAAAAGVSTRLVSSAAQVIERGSESLKNSVKLGEVSATDAASIVDLPNSEQDAAVKAVRKKRATTVAGASGKKKKAAATKEREPGDETENDPNAEPKEPEDFLQKIPKHLHPIAGSLKEFRSAINAIGKVRKQIEAICGAPGGGKLARVWSDTQRMCEQIAVNLKTYRFWAQCPECKITDKHTKADENCKLCRGHGWIAKTNGLSDHHKAWLREQGVDV